MQPRLNDKAMARMEERWKLKDKAVELLGVISAEFESGPTSVQCFDLRTVKESIKMVKRLEEIGYF